MIEVVVTGLGVTSAVGQGKPAFLSALMEGRHNFAVMQRPGRQAPAGSSFLGAEIAELSVPDSIPQTVLRTASFSSQVALATLHEAWQEAALEGSDAERIGLIVGGSNFQQRELVLTQERYRNRVRFIRPTYALSFMDTDTCGLCTEFFGIRGPTHTLGGASASGMLAVIQALHAIRSGQVDVCIALGALMDLSFWECQAFRSVGAMGSDRYADRPELACRPFDRDRDGFIYGENCAALVLESAGRAAGRSARCYARLSGSAMSMHGNRNPHPTLEGETGVIRRALREAGISAQDIDYVNPHATASPLGDETELQALRDCGLSHAYINTTKSIIGHGLTSAGAVEIAATLLQMSAAWLHPSRNLDAPLDESFNLVRQHSVPHRIKRALKLSMGFGGFNSALCLEAL
jgi:malonyl-ACP decarboxylase